MIFDVLGFTGVILYIGSYGLLQTGVIRGNGYTYAVLNVCAAVATLISLVVAFNVWSATCQIFFLMFSLIGIVRRYLASRRISFTDEERAFIVNRLGALSLPDARRFLSAGRWLDGQKGQTLTKDGAVVDGLYYVLRGSVSVLVNDKEIALLQDDNFIGEMSCLSGAPASATTRVSDAGRLFFIERQRLTELTKSNAALNEQIRLLFFEEVADKLRRTTLALDHQ